MFFLLGVFFLLLPGTVLGEKASVIVSYRFQSQCLVEVHSGGYRAREMLQVAPSSEGRILLRSSNNYSPSTL